MISRFYNFARFSIMNRIITKVGLLTAISLVIANMIGTGVFTSLGFQAAGIKSVLPLLLLWIAGGVVALCGALTYGELAASMPRSGGEYNYLSRLYHPAIGFLSGWVSATVGFAAPMAISAIAFGDYFSTIYPGVDVKILASGLIILLTLINISSFKLGSGFQMFFTLLNLALIVIISIAGLIKGSHEHFHFSASTEDFKQVLNPAFAISLIYVSFAYSGWNSASYIAGEIKDPVKNLPKALFSGTFIVMLLYVLLNFVFLYTVPIDALSGKLQVAHISAERIFGAEGAIMISGIISIGLIASVNAMMIAGPRVTQVIGEDFPIFKFLARKNASGTPVQATILQAVIALTLIATATFKMVMTYIGFTLGIFTSLTVAGIFIHRYRNGKTTAYTTLGFPVTPIIFLGLEFWMLYYTLRESPRESLWGLGTVITGLLVYYLAKENNSKREKVNQ